MASSEPTKQLAFATECLSRTLDRITAKWQQAYSQEGMYPPAWAGSFLCTHTRTLATYGPGTLSSVSEETPANACAARKGQSQAGLPD